MKVALVAMGKLENRYAVEFVEYYKNLGIDNIFIIDNNDYDGEWFEDVLGDYINNGFVCILNCRGLKYKGSQVMFYKSVYEQYVKNRYDWVFFCDFDEFLTFTKDHTIKEYLSRDCFKEYKQILINWKIYDDNDLIYDDGRGVLERFTRPIDKNKLIEYNKIPENCIVKPIIRGNINNLYTTFPHNFMNAEFKDTTCNASGKKILNTVTTKKIDWSLAYIKHFGTKTIDEFIHNKYKKGVGDRSYEEFLKTYPLERFFKYNKLTDEKLEFLKQNNIDISKLNNDNIDKYFTVKINW